MASGGMQDVTVEAHLIKYLICHSVKGKWVASNDKRQCQLTSAKHKRIFFLERTELCHSKIKVVKIYKLFFISHHEKLYSSKALWWTVR